MKRYTLFEKLEILLIVESLVLMMAMINEPPKNAARPPASFSVPVNMHQPCFTVC